MTADLVDWYGQLGWVDDSGAPVARPFADPLVDWLQTHPHVKTVEGGYWDVYRLAFLTEGQVHGVPFPTYPLRYPPAAPGDRSKRVIVARATPEGRHFSSEALRAGGRVVFQGRGVSVILMP
jgi:hypothetical protein